MRTCVSQMEKEGRKGLALLDQTALKRCIGHKGQNGAKAGAQSEIGRDYGKSRTNA